MMTYTVTAHDGETPIALPPTAHVVRLLGQDSGRYTVAIETSDPAALEAALETDATVISFEEEEIMSNIQTQTPTWYDHDNHLGDYECGRCGASVSHVSVIYEDGDTLHLCDECADIDADIDDPARRP